MRRDLLYVIGGLAVLLAVGIGGMTLLNSLAGKKSAGVPAAGGGAPSGNAGIEGWAQSMRAAGYEISYGAVAVKGNVATISDFQLSGPTDSFRWRWSAPQLQVLRGDGGRIALQLSGTQTVSYGPPGAERSASFTARGLQIEVLRNEGAHSTRIEANLTGLSLTPPDGGEMVTASRIQARFTLPDGAGAIPDRSGLSIAIEKLVIPSLQQSVLGKTLETLTAEIEFDRGLPSLKFGSELPAWRAAESGRIKVTRAKFNWGMVNLEGEGVLGFDPAYRPEGVLTARFRNLLPALDAFHVAQRLDPTVRADYYSALMEETALSRSEVSEFTLRLRAGEASLAREGAAPGNGGTPVAAELRPLSLGSIPPLLPLPPAAR
ncbi:MAG: DUF2125 domain-containing protein [Alphaproteobacteria bacterium]|nr:DUF2125 domain-containing protein [Alphaproteobacteria bacterium]